MAIDSPEPEPIKPRQPISLLEAAVAICICVLAWLIIKPMFRESDGTPLIHTQVQMRNTAIAMLVYHDTHESWPSAAAWRQQISPYMGEMKAEDTWEQPLIYHAGDEPTLQSFGLDGVDDSGKGDDIVLRVDKMEWLHLPNN